MKSLEIRSGMGGAFTVTKAWRAVMTDDTFRYSYRRFGHKTDRLIDRIRTYLSQRRAADWGFFLAGVVLGGLLF
jgi:hypothetical protein